VTAPQPASDNDLELSISRGYTRRVFRPRPLAPTLPSLLCLSLALAGCGDTSGSLPAGDPLDQIGGFSGVPSMNPGVDCMSCHAPGANASDRPWTVAGTVFAFPGDLPDAGVEGAEILLTDVTGKKLTLHSNGAGNFYTIESLGALTDVEVQRGGRRMVMNLAVFDGGALSVVGSCNHCHQPRGISGAPGRVFVPIE